MSTVFKAMDLENARQLVAVKIPLPQYSSGLGSWSMFQREAEIGASLSHASVVRFIPLPRNTQRGYVVTEYVAGAALSALVGRGRPLGEPEALRIASLLCEAVQGVQPPADGGCANTNPHNRDTSRSRSAATLAR